MHDEPRTDAERRALAAFTAAEPPVDFADRVLAALAAEGRSEPERAPFRRFFGLGLPRLAGVAAAGVLAVAVAAVAAAAAGWLPEWTGLSRHAPEVIPAQPPRDEVSIGAALPEGPPVPALALPADLAARIDAYVGAFGRNYGEAFEFHGVVGVVKDGELVLSRGYGRADLGRESPIDADTKFKIGSLTQTFTAVAVLQLRDRGLVDLDAPVRKYIPDYPAIGSRITVRQLLTHTSGIPSYTDAAVFSVGHARAVAAADVRALFQDLPLEFVPGTDFDLSNSGYFLLGQLVEQVAREPFADYLRANVLAPAGMKNSGLGLSADALGHEFDEDEVLVPAAQRHFSAYGGAAGMVSTAADLARWDRALRTPGLLLSQKSLDEMTTVVREEYGMGWFVRQDGGSTIAWHPGGVEGYNATIARFLGDGITVFVLANTEAVDTRAVTYDLAQIVHGGEVQPPREFEEVRLSAPQLARYVGNYVLTETTHKELKGLVEEDELSAIEQVRVFRRGDRLWMNVPEHGDKWMHFMGEDRFFFKDPSATIAEFGPPGAPVAHLTLQAGELRFILKKE
ncbi:serine hydrolase domain-containing protein [Nannocystis pusilla]|uniref:serine hydrolase domain-containing protein n=1 Tax=Nannocystis pusilla TaxID=889268 RepID=UPI003B7D5BEE